MCLTVGTGSGIVGGLFAPFTLSVRVEKVPVKPGLGFFPVSGKVPHAMGCRVGGVPGPSLCECAG